MSNELYLNNPLIHHNRQLKHSSSTWAQQFSCEHIKPLIVCRGPIRKEAMDVFSEMGISHYGILLSEKDSIVYRTALAPELRQHTDPNHIHRVPDYTGANKEEREARIQQIIAIAKDNGYNAVFAGYGFMAEDENLVLAIEEAGLNFIGPCSTTVRRAGFKDEAKRTALEVGVSVTPGLDNATTVTLLNKYPDSAALSQLVETEALVLAEDPSSDLETYANQVLTAAYKKGIDVYSIAELQDTIRSQVLKLNTDYPENRIRLKCIGGGGGKGQRILPNPADMEGDDASRLTAVADLAPGLVMEILNEVKATGVGDNKNILIELNIETTRHQEIQVLGNGDWTLALGGRDCSLQMHEQKLLEVSVTEEDLAQAHSEVSKNGQTAAAEVLSRDIDILRAMEDEAERFGQAVGLDSVSTFECIVDRSQHFFMEMNTRIQVEHRVTELCYSLKFVNPSDPEDYFIADSLVEVMVLLAAHGKALPKPERINRYPASVEARLNATNQALAPHAGGIIEYWSDTQENEIRDDQGICRHNPDTDVFMKYHLAGAYDSNIALLLSVGDSRLHSYQRMAEILRVTVLEGKDLETNLDFHYGLVNWFLGNDINARPTTRFMLPYLTAVGELKQACNEIDVAYAYQAISKQSLASAKSSEAQKEIKLILNRKKLLITRAIEKLFENPHVLAGWLSIHQDVYEIDAKGSVTWLKNSVDILTDLYHFLNMDYQADGSAANMIWDHDDKLLKEARAFYARIAELSKTEDFKAQAAWIMGSKPSVWSDELPNWSVIQAAHLGFQMGNELLSLIPFVAHKASFFDLKVNEDLTIHIPDRLLDAELQSEMAKVLVPPPQAKSDEILAPMGGMFYAAESPGARPFVTPGDHFEVGDPLCIIEVMKMFNKIYAPFSGTIESVHVEDDGQIIRKGQMLFKIKPDVPVSEVSEEAVKEAMRKATQTFIDTLS